LLGVTASVAQEKGAKKNAMPSQEEMTKRWQDSMTPGDSHKALESFVGSWTTQSSVWMDGPEKPPSVSPGTAEVKWVLGGRFLQMEMTGGMMGMPMNGIGFTGYDNFKKKYINFWIDNTATAMFTSEGTVTQEKNKPVKYIQTIVGSDKHIFEIHDMSIKGGKTKVVEMVYERKK
jgi:hypothetical protein